jgi:hypothetical protein
LPNLPIRPKTAFRYFFEHSIQLRKEKKDNDSYNLSPIPEIGEGVGMLALTKQKKRKPGFFSNISADWKTLDEEDRKVYEEYQR